MSRTNYNSYLYQAMKDKNFSKMKYFIANGADPNTVDENSNTVLHLIAYYSDVETLISFMRIGRYINIKNKNNLTAADIAEDLDKTDMYVLLTNKLYI